MARKVFFSFHYGRDVWRAGVVRNSWVTKPDRETAGFWDKAAWEEVEKRDDDAIHDWINQQIAGTSVTVVLIGYETSTRRYVNYEIRQSYLLSHGMMGIYIHNIKDVSQRTDFRGANPFYNWQIQENGRNKSFAEIYPVYDWVTDDGYNNLGSWVEAAAYQAGKR